MNATDRDILAARPPKNRVDERVPYAFFVESECAANGRVEDVATIFLTNRECPFHCLFCDLWKNTTDSRVPVGAIPQQIDYARSRLPAVKHIKLYNSGNFFDPQAVPTDDFAEIAARLRDFETVIVENHPRLCGESCLAFHKLISETTGAFPPYSNVRLEVAMGLETVHPEILPQLNKQMTLDDFVRAANFLRSNDIEIRAFILLKPPFMPEAECVPWAVRALEFAFDCGVRVCTVIPTRGGNGVMESLVMAGSFAPPRISEMEAVLEQGLNIVRGQGWGRIFVDLWDVDRLAAGEPSASARITRLKRMNLEQIVIPEC